MAFYCNPIRERDPITDQLVKAGVSFEQGSNSQFHNFSTMGGGILAAIGIGLFGAVVAIFSAGFGLLIILGAVGFAGFMMWGLANGAPRQRTLYFTRENRLYDESGKYYIEWTPRNIESIEARLDDRNKDPALNPNFPVAHVAVTNDDGQVGRVAADLHRDNAIQVARQLQKAHQEILASMMTTVRMEGNTMHVSIGDLDEEDPLSPSPAPPRPGS